jgi:hypothetical protein
MPSSVSGRRLSLFKRRADNRADGDSDADPYTKVVKNWTKRNADRDADAEINAHPKTFGMHLFFLDMANSFHLQLAFDLQISDACF